MENSSKKKEKFLNHLKDFGDDFKKKVEFLETENNNPFLNTQFRKARWNKFKNKQSFNSQCMNSLKQLGEEIMIGRLFLLFLLFFTNEKKIDSIRVN